MTRILSLSCALFALTFQGCAPSTPTAPGLSYVSSTKVPIAVSCVSVGVSPYVTENNPLIALPLSKMIKQWASDYWNPTGGAYVMHFYIQNISMKDEVLACSCGPQKWVSVKNSDIYKGNMSIECQLQTPNGRVLAKTQFTIRHEQHVPENYTIIQRKALWNQVCEGMINELTLETNTHIPGMIRRLTGAPS